MCGIFGFVSEDIKNPGEFWQFADRLFYHTARRGPQASGFAATVDGKFITDKRALSAEYFTKISRPWRDLRHAGRQIALVGHTRAATSGSPEKNENNHPFTGPRYSVAHNGGVGDHKRVAAALGYNLRSECDSEILLHLVEDGKTIDDGILKVYSEVDRLSWMAVCVLEREKGVVHLFKDGNSPCGVYHIPRWNVTLFCSTNSIVADAITDVIGWRQKAINQVALLYEPEIPAYTRVTIKKNGEIEDKFLKDKISEPSYSLDRRLVYGGHGRYSDEADEWQAWHDVAVYGGRVQSSSTTSNNNQPNKSATSGPKSYEDTAIFYNCPNCRMPVDEYDLEDGACPSCHTEIDLDGDNDDSARDAMRNIIANERKASSGLLASDEEVLGEDDADDGDAGIDIEEERRVVRSFSRIVRLRDPNPVLSDADMKDYLFHTSMSWSAKRTLWQDLTISKVKKMSKGEWKAYLNYLRDEDKESVNNAIAAYDKKVVNG